MLPYGRQEVTPADIQAVVEVLESDFLTQGPMVPRFEEAVAEYCRARFAVGVNSATSALHLGCQALEVGPGDNVWTTPITFAASANCALYCGADLDFVDIDAATFNMSVDKLASMLEEADRVGRLPKVVIPVHLGGQSCDMEGIGALAEQYGFRVIEDASHAIGGRYRNEPVGCGRHSDITVFSFHPVKVVTSAEGGMAVTNDPELSERMARLRTHGITRDPAAMVRRSSEGEWYYEQVELGYNYRLSDVHAALGLSQFQRVDEIVDRRNSLAERYDKLLAHLPVTPQARPQATHSAFHLYILRLRLSEAAPTHPEVFAGLRSRGIGVNLHYIPVYRHPYHARLVGRVDCPEAERYYAEAITLPLFPSLTEAQLDQVVDALQAVLEEA